MTKFIRTHQKKFLAIFGVLLMVIFIIPSAFKNSGRSDHVIASIGDQKVYASEALQAEDEWKSVRSYAPRAILEKLSQDGVLNASDQQTEYAQIEFVQQLCSEIDNKPILFLLLQKEAIKQGVIAPVYAPNPNDQGPDAEERRQASHSLMLVAGLMEQLADTIKPTEAGVTLELAQNYQKAQLTVVTFTADQYRDSIPAPTPDQLRKMYDRLSDVLPTLPATGNANSPPNPPSTDNPLGFGYELPRRVKLQFIVIPRRALLDVVAKNPPPADLLEAQGGSTGNIQTDWEVAAMKYRLDNIKDYPNILPGTNPATLPTSQPYDQVRQDILDHLRAPAADALEQQVREAILVELQKDSAQYNATTRPAPPSAAAASQPDTRPATQPAVAAPMNMPFASEKKLTEVVNDIEKKFGFETHWYDPPAVREVADYADAAKLASLPNIGQASADGVAFADYAIGSDDPTAAAKNLHVLQPSNWLSDGKNSYIFRLTAIAPAAPEPFDAVEAQVAADWTDQQAYDKAVAAAKDLSAKAQAKLLRNVALAAGVPAFNTGYFMPQSRDPNDTILQVSNSAQHQVKDEAQALLGLATASDPHPIGVVDVPATLTVYVLQLAGTESAEPGNMWRARLVGYADEDSEFFLEVASRYFDYDSVAQRLGYKPLNEGT